MRYFLLVVAFFLSGCSLFGADDNDGFGGEYVAYELNPERKVYTLSIEKDGSFDDGPTRLVGSATRVVSNGLSKQADLLGSVANNIGIQCRHARDTLSFSGERTEGVVRGEFRDSRGVPRAVMELRPE